MIVWLSSQWFSFWELGKGGGGQFLIAFAVRWPLLTSLAFKRELFLNSIFLRLSFMLYFATNLLEGNATNDSFWRQFFGFSEAFLSENARPTFLLVAYSQNK